MKTCKRGHSYVPVDKANRRGCLVCLKLADLARRPNQRIYMKSWWKRNKVKKAEYDRQARLEDPSLFNFKARTRELSKKQRMPKWLTKEQLSQIKSFYKLAKSLAKEKDTKFHVDHIVPLHGNIVSGLHVPWNLQVIPATENLLKGASF